MQVSYVHFGQRPLLSCEGADVADSLKVVDGLKMVSQRLTGDGDTLFNDHRGFNGGQRIPFDRVGGVGQFKVLGMVEIGRASG